MEVTIAQGSTGDRNYVATWTENQDSSDSSDSSSDSSSDTSSDTGSSDTGSSDTGSSDTTSDTQSDSVIEQPESGCGASVSGVGILALLTVLGAGFAFKKKRD